MAVPRKITFFVIVGALLTVVTAWAVRQADHSMKAQLLEEARLVKSALDLKYVLALSGSEADLDRPDYQELKELFARVKEVRHDCRFVYLLGRRTDGHLFIFVDNEPPGARDYSAPGDFYEEAAEGLHRVFDTGEEAVLGPLRDRWGLWISALVPVRDPDTGSLIAVLGMDIHARDWLLAVWLQAAFPVALLVTLAILMITIFTAVRKVRTSSKPVLWRLLPPLTIMLVLLIMVSAGLLWRQYQTNADEHISDLKDSIEADFRDDLKNQASGLALAMGPMTENPRVQQCLGEGDRDSLLRDWGPVFETMHREHNLTHFYFLDARRVCILRIHKPEKYGDRIDRFTALEAERTKDRAAGVELGPLGTLTLRAVQPVFHGGELRGYVELGKEIEDILDRQHFQFSSHVAMALSKDYLIRDQWEEGMRLLGRKPEWERLENSVISYSSFGRLPDSFTAAFDDDPRMRDSHEPRALEIVHEGKVWRVVPRPFEDVAGRKIGSLLIMTDRTAQKKAFQQVMVLGMACAGVLLAGLLGFVFVLLSRVDQGIRAGQAQLTASEEKNRLLVEHAISAIAMHEIVLDGTGRPVDYIFLSVNPAFERHTGLDPREVIGRRVTEVVPGIEKTSFIERFGKVVQTGETVNFEEYFEPLGRYYSVNAYRLGGKRFATVFTDITARKRAEDDLLRERERLSAIIEGTNAGTWEWNVETGETVFNERWAGILGYTLEEISPVSIETWQRFAHPEDLKESARLIEKHFRGELPYYKFESRMKHKDGRWVWVLDRGKVSRWTPDGRPLLMQGTHQDITARKQAEEQQRFELRFQEAVSWASGRFLSATAENLDEAIFEILARLGGLFEVDRSYVFRFSEDLRQMTNTHEWCAEGIVPQKDRIRDVSVDLMTWWKKQIFGLRPVHIPDVNLLPPEAENEKKEFLSQGIRSLLCLPMVGDRGELMGFMGFDAVSRPESWPEEQIGMLQVVAELIAAAMSRSRVQEKLRESEEQFKSLVSNIPGVTYRCRYDREWTMLYLSADIESISGYPASDFVQSSVRAYQSIIHRKDAPGLARVIREAVESGRTWEIEYRLIHRDGSVRWVYEKGRAVAGQNKAVEYLDGFILDITARKKAEEKVLKLSQAVEQSSATVVITDKDGVIEYANPAFEKISGYSVAEAVGKNPRILKSGDQPAELYRELWETIAAGKVWHGEFHNKKKSGELYWEAVSIAPIRDETGSIRHYVAVKEDITGRKARELELKRLTQELERSNRELNDFAYIVSHDLKAPLRGMASLTTWLESDFAAKLGEEGAKQLRLLKERSIQLDNFINGILEYSRLGRVSEQKEEVDLNDLLKEVVFLLNPPPHITVTVGEGLPVLRCQRVRVQQVFQNLISNAVHYMDKDPGHITLTCREAGAEWEFCVEDNGPGIEERHFERIFKLFQIIPVSGKKQGTGIGLSLIKKTVEMHGGRIWLESEPGRGSRFYFTLPRSS